MKVPLGSMFLVAALVAVPVLTHAAAPQTPAVQPTDKTIDDRVEARINADSSLKKHSIVVTVDEGVVTLTGVVHPDRKHQGRAIGERDRRHPRQQQSHRHQGSEGDGR